MCYYFIHQSAILEVKDKVNEKHRKLVKKTLGMFFKLKI